MNQPQQQQQHAPHHNNSNNSISTYDLNKQNCTCEHWNSLQTSLQNAHKSKVQIELCLHRLRQEEHGLVCLAMQAERQRVYMQSQYDMMMTTMRRRSEEEKIARRAKEGLIIRQRQLEGTELFYFDEHRSSIIDNDDDDNDDDLSIRKCLQIASVSTLPNVKVDVVEDLSLKRTLTESLSRESLQSLVARIFPSSRHRHNSESVQKTTSQIASSSLVAISNCPIVSTPTTCNPPPIVDWQRLRGPNHLVFSVLPYNFPPELSVQALSIYAVLRTMSLTLLVSPFTPVAFLRALSLRMPSSLLNEIHEALLRLLFANLQEKSLDTKKGKIVAPFSVDKPLFPGLERRNWRYIDAMTWPLFLSDYSDMKRYQYVNDERVFMFEDLSDNDSHNKTDQRLSEAFDDEDDEGGSISVSDADEVSDDDMKQHPRPAQSMPKRSRYDIVQDKESLCLKRSKMDDNPFEQLQPVISTENESVSLPVSFQVPSYPGNQLKTVAHEHPRKKGRNYRRLLHSIEKTTTGVEDSDNTAESIPFIEAICQLRNKNYHLLTLKQKLEILEFLVDELLQIIPIKTILHSRVVELTSDYSEVFHNEPTKEDLKGIVNVDGCVACGEEGALICCDGCVNSYHRKCASLPLNRDLLGQWICPECRIPDSSKYGSLAGGFKSHLEWFTLADLSNLRSSIRKDILQKYDDMLFLVLHGFVFTRSYKNQLDEPELMSQIRVYNLLHDLGPEVCAKWPWSQIPMNPIAIFPKLKHASEITSHYKTCVTEPVYFNPLIYINVYKKAEYPFQTNAIPKNLNLYEDQDTRLFQFDPSCYSPLISLINSKDDIKTSKLYHFQCIKPIKDYLLQLEQSLSKAFLLPEWWETENEAKWSSKVREARGTRSLVRLLLILIDIVHHRALDCAWNRSPLDKAKRNAMRKENHRHYISLLNRNRTLEEEANDHIWMNKINPISMERASVINNNRLGRKLKRKLSSNTNIKDTQVSNINAMLSKISRNGIDDENKIGVNSAKGNEKRSKRRSLRTKVSSISNNGLYSVSPMENNVKKYTNKADRLHDMCLSLRDQFEKQDHWEICGRKLFSPSGEISLRLQRTLARRGGILYAPFMHYSAKHEVVQPTFGQMWKQETRRCITVSELVLQLYTLEEYLQKPVIQSCQSIGYRLNATKNHSSNSIQRCIRNESTGLIEYFVYNKNKDKGCWFSEDIVELQTLLQYRYVRSKYRRSCYKLKFNKTALQEMEASKLRNVVQQRNTMLNSMQQSLENTREFDRNAQNKVNVKRKEVGAKLQLLINETAVIDKVNSDIIQYNHPNARPNKDQIRTISAQLKKKFELAFKSHMRSTLEMLRDASNSGMVAVSNEAMSNARINTITTLRQLNGEIRSRFGTQREIPDPSLLQKIGDYEQKAQQEFQKEVEARRSLSRSARHNNNEEDQMHPSFDHNLSAQSSYHYCSSHNTIPGLSHQQRSPNTAHVTSSGYSIYQSSTSSHQIREDTLTSAHQYPPNKMQPDP